LNTHPVLIVGGGLAGLIAARRLHQAGCAFQLLEARNRLGGRILSTDATGEEAADSFDLGPSWFWPGMQPVMAALIQELGLASFAQHSEGDVIFHRMSREVPRRYQGLRQEPQSMRVVGGTGAIISSLFRDLPKTAIRLGARVTHVALDGHVVTVDFVTADGNGHRLQAAHVIFALPPRLLEATVSFTPLIGPEASHHWRDTPTWMAPHAKFFAIYDRPFWREAGLSGTAQSMVGPLVEIHDATTAGGEAALFGFVGIPAERRVILGRDAIVAASLQQLADLFGPPARTPRATLLKDWAADPLTATADDRLAGSHPRADGRPWIRGKWQEFISLAGSEASRNEPGYLAGAVDAAEYAVKTILLAMGASKCRI
jgi:monoamine oxidase